MAEQLLRRLKALTPNAAGIDRDALLFQLGQASAQRRLRWHVVSGLLAMTQILTLILLWNRDPQPRFIPPQIAQEQSHQQPTAGQDTKETPGEPVYGAVPEVSSLFAESYLAKTLQQPVENDYGSADAIWEQLELDPLIRKYLMWRAGKSGE
jgi:hypothetical protein